MATKSQTTPSAEDLFKKAMQQVKKKQGKSTTLKLVPKCIIKAIEDHHQSFWKHHGYKMNRPDIYIKIMAIGLPALMEETKVLKATMPA